ncbi:MAG: hypothetical protein ABEJ85_03015 [Haloarculaceae archaeon]
MSDSDLEARLAAVERALTDGDTDLATAESVDLAADVERLEERLDAIEGRLDDLDAAVQAVRGYAGNVRAVNREVERRASAALAKVETLETAVQGEDQNRVEDRSRPVDPLGGPARDRDERRDGRDRSDPLAAGDRQRQHRDPRDEGDIPPGNEGCRDERAGGPDGTERAAEHGAPAPGSGQSADRWSDGQGHRERDHQRADERIRDGDGHGSGGSNRRRRGRSRGDESGRRDERSEAGDDILGRSDLDVERLRDGDRSNGEDGEQGRSESTTQFIERVRDVL